MVGIPKAGLDGSKGGLGMSGRSAITNKGICAVTGSFGEMNKEFSFLNKQAVGR